MYDDGDLLDTCRGLEPLPRAVRPSSAGGKLQTHAAYYAGILEDKRPTGLTELPKIEHRVRPVTAQQMRTKERASPRLAEKQKARRPTITTNDDVKRLLEQQKSFNVSRLLGDVVRGKIESRIDLNALDSLKRAFHNADVSHDGRLNMGEFKSLLKDKLRVPSNKEGQVEALFDKIDWSSEGEITWDEFCTYMQVEFAEKEDSYLRAKEVAFNLPALVEMTPHRNDVVRIGTVADGSFIILSIDGLFSFWSSNCDLKKTRSIITNEQSQRTNAKWITDFIIMSEFNKIVVTTGDRELEFFEQSSFEPYCCVCGLETIPLKLTYHTPKDNLDESLIIFGDRQGCVNILLLHATGESLRTWKKASKSDGIPTVTLEYIVNTPSVEFIRWKVHTDWINELHYEPSINQIISCSNDDDSSVVIGCVRGSTNIDASLKEVHAVGHGAGAGAGAGAASGRVSRSTSISGPAHSAGSARPSETPQAGLAAASSAHGSLVQHLAVAVVTSGSSSTSGYNTSFNNWKSRLDSDQLVFKIYKGARTFAFSNPRNVMVTGGMDRIIRCWNPYVPSKPTGFLHGHTTPLVYLCIDDNENRLFSMSQDKCVKVWDLLDLSCLLTVRPKGHQIRGDFQCCHMSIEAKTLCVATDQMAMLNLKLRPHMRSEIVLSHKEPVSVCRFNPLRNHLISCSEGSIIKVWDMESGAQMFECGEAHGEAAITCACFDLTGRRLVTGGRDGCLRVWNYINGHCLQTLCKEKNNEELSGVTYVEMNKNRYIIAVGWDKAINVYNDNPHDSIRQVNRPLPRWPDDAAHGHKEDILAIADCPPNFLATSSYDGVVIVWNMISGHVMVQLHAPAPHNYVDYAIDGDMGVSKLCFIQSRMQHRTEGVLVTSGPRAHIHIWTVFHGGKLMAQFRPSPPERQAQISGLVVGEDKELKATVLVTADELGYVYVWNITDYARTTIETAPPPIIATWRAHTEMITNVEYSAAHRAVVSASTDCTVRLWTIDGHYIGTFGQPTTWNIYDPSTYQHPMVPYDVLIDPRSLPSRLNREESAPVQKTTSRVRITTEQSMTASGVSLNLPQTFNVDDATIADQIRQKIHRMGQGKRLRHEILKPVILDHGGPSNYQNLVCFELQQPPKFAEPQQMSTMRKRQSYFE